MKIAHSQLSIQIRLFITCLIVLIFFSSGYSQRVTNLGILCWSLNKVLCSEKEPIILLIVESLTYITDILMKQASMRTLYSVSCNYLTSLKNWLECFKNFHKNTTCSLERDITVATCIIVSQIVSMKVQVV